MEYRRFGRTGLKVSRLGLGCGGFGGVGSDPSLFGGGEDEATAFAIMDRALELGINYLDTANSYDGGLSRRHVVRAVEDSLRRLGTEWLDLYVTHDVDHETPLEETLRAFDDL